MLSGLPTAGARPASPQTSDAIGCAASQLGPRALALATQLNKGLGLPYGKTAAVLEEAFGLRVSRGGLCQAMARVACKGEPTYQALIEQIRGSPSVTPDETGWKVGGQLWWMWAFSTSQVTVYAIQPGRGFEPAARVLGRTLPVFWCAMAGASIVNFSRPCTKPAWPIYYGAAGR